MFNISVSLYVTREQCPITVNKMPCNGVLNIIIINSIIYVIDFTCIMKASGANPRCNSHTAYI